MDLVADKDTPAAKYLDAIWTAGQKVEECLQKVKMAMEKWWNWSKRTSVTYSPGDLVLVSSERLPSS
jgi:hypothetical protein